MIWANTEKANNICNYISSSLSPQSHLKPAGESLLKINRAEVPGTVSAGFPWYFFQQDAAKKFLEKIITDFGFIAGIETTIIFPIDIFEMYPYFRNPVNPALKFYLI